MEDADVEEEDTSQDQDPHFVQTCAIEMQTDISQEPFITEIYRGKMPRHKGRDTLARACAVEMHLDMSHEPTLCASLRSLNSRQHVTRAALNRLIDTYRKKRPRPRLCASVRSRNPHQHATRVILYFSL